jgi:hypothetical protein
MSWWDTPQGLVLGDGPADVVQRTLEVLAGRREAQGRPRPALAELLDAASAALGLSGRRLVLRSEDRPDVTSGAGAVDGELESALRQAFAEVAADYRTTLQREPRIEELLETIVFILGSRPERYLADAEGLEVLALVSEEAPE